MFVYVAVYFAISIIGSLIEDGKAKNGIFGIIIKLFSSLFKVVWHTKCVLPNWRGIILVSLSRINGDKKKGKISCQILAWSTQLIRPEQWWNMQKWKMPSQSSLINQTSEKIAFQLPLRFGIKIVQEITMWGTHQLVGFMLCWSDTVVKLKINSQLADQVEEKKCQKTDDPFGSRYLSVCRSSYYISTVIH